MRGKMQALASVHPVRTVYQVERRADVSVIIRVGTTGAGLKYTSHAVAVEMCRALNTAAGFEVR